MAAGTGPLRLPDDSLNRIGRIIEAARLADAMRGCDDGEEQAFWIKVARAISELEAQPAVQRQQRQEPNVIRAGD